MDERYRTVAEVQTLLMQVLLKTGADRAWVVEFHNGTKNMSTDLPFVYGTMRPEVVLDGGRVNGFDTHEKLVETNEIYREIYESQVKGGGDFDVQSAGKEEA